MVGRSTLRADDSKHLTGAADAIAPADLNLLLLALMNDITGVQT
jgi:hypothetical protein